MRAAYRVTLTDVEQRLAICLGKMRNARDQAAGVTNTRRSGRSDEAVNIDGAGGEIAFARLVNVYPDLSTEPRRGGADCVLPDGRRVDVKTTLETPRASLLVLPHKIGAVDLYALMLGTLPAYRFAGHVDAVTYFLFAEIIDLGHGPTHSLPVMDLDPELPTCFSTTVTVCR